MSTAWIAEAREALLADALASLEGSGAGEGTLFTYN